MGSGKGIGTSVQNEEDDEDTILLSLFWLRLHLPETMTFEEYLGIDNEVQAHEELTEEVCIVISNILFNVNNIMLSIVSTVLSFLGNL